MTLKEVTIELSMRRYDITDDEIKSLLMKLDKNGVTLLEAYFQEPFSKVIAIFQRVIGEEAYEEMHADGF